MVSIPPESSQNSTVKVQSRFRWVVAISFRVGQATFQTDQNDPLDPLAARVGIMGTASIDIVAKLDNK